MCYAKPGPRCFHHAAKDVMKYEACIQKLKAKGITQKNLANSAKMLETSFTDGQLNYVQYERARKKNTKSSKELMHVFYELSESKKKRDATSKGIERLKCKIQESSLSPESQNKYALRLTTAIDTFENKMAAYDHINHTVNGRQPSRYGTPDGIRELRRRQIALLPQTAKYERSLRTVQHALETEKRVRSQKLILTIEQDAKTWVRVVSMREKMLQDYEQLHLTLNIMERKIVRAENLLERFGAGSMKKLLKMRDTIADLRTRKMELATELRLDSDSRYAQ